MSTAYEVMEEDVITVARANGLDIDDESSSDILDTLDHVAIEKAALFGDSMEDQTAYAYEEIERQLRGAGILPSPGPAR